MSTREIKELKDTIKRTSVKESRRDKGMQSEYLYGTIVEYDPETQLSAVDILEEEHDSVPKLEHVNLFSSWRVFSTGKVEQGFLTVEVPEHINAIRGTFGYNGNATAGSSSFITFRAGETDVTDFNGQYRRGRVTIQSNGSISDSDHHSSGSYWDMGLASGIASVGEFSLIPQRFEDSGTSTNYQFQGSMTRVASGVANSRSLSWGRINDTSFTKVGVIGIRTDVPQFGVINWSIEGKNYDDTPVGKQVLMVRSKLVPLTIIGVLSGSTTT